MCVGFGKHPPDLASARDIKKAPADAWKIRIGLLPIENYPLLAKFDQVKEVDFFGMDRKGSADEKLDAFSRLPLNKLETVVLLYCSGVTDTGIRYLTRMTSLRGLNLVGTSITDDALKTIAMEMKLTGVNVAGCSNVTMKGLVKLAPLDTFEYIGLSTFNVTQEEVLHLIDLFQSVTYCLIHDPTGKLDVDRIKSIGKAKGVRVVIQSKAALET